MSRSVYEQENRTLRIEAQALAHALAEARALNADLMLQVDRANAAAVRMAQRVVRAGMRRAA